MHLTDAEREEVKRLVDQDETLPDKYRFVLFREPREAELIWPGKTHEVTNVVLPFQSIEQIDEPRAEGVSQDDLFQMDRATGRQSGGWSNKLIWGDNKLVLSSLKGGPLRREIENAGGLKLVYIDPPFDVGADFSFQIEIGDETVTKVPSVLEDIAYRDTWGRGADSYIAMLNERLTLLKELMATDSAIFVHVGPTVSHYVRMILEEIFGANRFVNEIIWRRAFAHNDPSKCGFIHDSIYYFSKGESRTWNKTLQEPSAEYVEQFFDQYDPIRKERYARLPLDAPRHGNGGNLLYEWKGAWPAKNRTWANVKENMEAFEREGRIHYPKSGMPRLKRYESEYEGTPIQDLWTDINKIHNQSPELLDYSTQKPEALLSRIVSMASNKNDLIADFFCGSGTTLAVAEKLGRKWIGCDLGRFAIHTARKRLIGVQRELKAENKPYRSFEILNLGKYERQYFVGIDMSLPEEQRRTLSVQKEEHYLSLILCAYKAERVFQSAPFHGRKGGAFVVVGPLDAPVTRGQIGEAAEAARRLKCSRVDVLGFEFEMGVTPLCVDEAKARGVGLALRYIPKEVFDRRAVEKNQVTFYDVAYMDVKPTVKGRIVSVTLADFGVSYRQDDADSLAGEMKPGTKVTVADGQVVKITKDKSGLVKRDVLTKKWTDWIDYWAVDFDYASRPETLLVTIAMPDGAVKHVPQWTGGYIFENEWQSFRTRKDRTLELESAPHEYAKKGRYKIAVKVIDIFGNDTTKVVEVSV